MILLCPKHYLTYFWLGIISYQGHPVQYIHLPLLLFNWGKEGNYGVVPINKLYESSGGHERWEGCDCLGGGGGVDRREGSRV